jgi:hypothetical protein
MPRAPVPSPNLLPMPPFRHDADRFVCDLVEGRFTFAPLLWNVWGAGPAADREGRR